MLKWAKRLQSNPVTLVLAVPKHQSIIEILMSTGIHEISTVSVLVRPIKLDFRPIAASLLKWAKRLQSNHVTLVLAVPSIKLLYKILMSTGIHEV